MTSKGKQGSGVGFQVIPAVDLLGDEAVRLERGDFERVSLRAGDPEALVRRFAAAGASLIHIVDLGGARAGRTRPDLIARLARVAAPVPVQASGGIRSTADALALLAAGATRVIVGTAAFSAPGALERFAEALGEQLVVAVDVREGRIAVSGWEQVTDLAVDAAARRCATAGVARLHCTAIERDGTMGGPDLVLLARVRELFGGPVVAAGGVRSEADLASIEAIGLEGAVVGRALLEGGVPLTALAGR
ncbi:MAG: 1-(5-phosphoribosyl)-5-[(5-phosphoribosylamino)methylideneamino] imidazole-4-carboxamide isomerase [Thermoleophilia bacterium]|nr:1-(5-phosphoribosyl)-5-[(5-phosphoribosylamino)methylideneamino] imidazole-4-carboxamide isomerase [Thermoleophilia bacterium]